MKAKEKFEQLKTAKNLNDQVLLAFYDTLLQCRLGRLWAVGKVVISRLGTGVMQL